MATLVLSDGNTLRTQTPLQRMSPAASGPMVSATPITSERRVTLSDGADGPRVISFERIVETQPVVAAAVNRLLRQIATLPLKTYRRNSQNERERVIDHPADRLIRSPAPRKGALHLKQWMARPNFVHGNALLAKYRGDGPDRPPTNLLPLRWQHVSAYAQMGGPVEYWGTMQTGEWKWLPVEESLHFAWESGDGELGVSPLTQLGVTIGLEDAAQRYQSASFRNGARPSGAVVLPEGVVLKEEDEKRLRAGLRAMHEGVDNAFRVALLTGGADWKPMSFSANEAQLMEQRNLNKREIAMVYDVPSVLLGDTEASTYNNVAELHKMLYTTILRPWLTFFEETLYAQLIAPEDEWLADDIFFEFDLGEVLRGEPASELAAAAEAFASGLMTLNEVRKVLNLPPIGDPADPKNPANRPHIPANNLQPLGGAEASAADTEPPPILT